MKALLGDSKQSALYLVSLNTRMSMRTQDLNPWREIRSGQQPKFVAQWKIWLTFVYFAPVSGCGRAKAEAEISFASLKDYPWGGCCYGHLVLALDSIHNVHKHKHSVKTFNLPGFIKSRNQVSRAGDHQRWIGSRRKYHPQRIIKNSIWDKQSFWRGVGANVF